MIARLVSFRRHVVLFGIEASSHPSSVVACYTAACFAQGRFGCAAFKSKPITLVALLILPCIVPLRSDAAVNDPNPGVSPALRRSAGTSTADLRSAAYLIVDVRSTEVLLERKADLVMPIASITKLMTALVVLEAGQPLDEALKIASEDRDIEVGRRSRLAVGTVLTRGELLRLALMSSDNRAANAVGRNYPGGLPALLKAMNTKARALGMKTARFTDATGLSDGNVASPRDLVKLVVAAADHPKIREFSTDPEQTVMVGNSLLEYRNTNVLVSQPDWDVVVQKTGYTNAAGQCLVMKTMIQDRPIVMVLMNSFGKYTRVADARRARRWMEESAPAPGWVRASSHAAR